MSQGSSIIHNSLNDLLEINLCKMLFYLINYKMFYLNELENFADNPNTD